MLPPFRATDSTHSLIKRQKKTQAEASSSSPPHTVIVCHQHSFLQAFLSQQPHQARDSHFSKLYFLTDHPNVAIGHFGSTSSLIASKMEELIHSGVEQFISIGTAGTLQTKAQIGDLIVCEKAIRDESTSGQYLPSTKYIHAPRRMTNRLQYEFKKANLPYHIGSTWTTDRLYQEVEKTAGRYQQEGVIAIDREAASLFAVAHFYQVDLGVLFTISDSLADLFWQPHDQDPRVYSGLSHLINIAKLAARHEGIDAK